MAQEFQYLAAGGSIIRLFGAGDDPPYRLAVEAGQIPGVLWLDDVWLLTDNAWSAVMLNQMFDAATTTANSATYTIDGWSACWVHIFIDSTGAPTDIRILPQFSDDGGVTWWDFEEGLWASLYWEDTDTGAGIRKAYLLPCGGEDLLRFNVTATGTGALATFQVTIRVRAFRGNFGVAHA